MSDQTKPNYLIFFISFSFPIIFFIGGLCDFHIGAEERNARDTSRNLGKKLKKW